MSETRVRREPPAFRLLEVRDVQLHTPRLVRVTLGGAELAGFDPGLPAASIRLLLPPAGGEIVMPEWNGNEFRFADGTRPPIRTLTPLRHDAEAEQLDVEIVRHGSGPLSDWADRAALGERVALSGPGRGYLVDPHAPAFLLAGDESALPAITSLIPALPHAASVHVVAEISDPEARFEMPAHPDLTEDWCPSLLDAIAAVDIDPGTRVWVAGEAATVQRVRKHLFDERSVPREHAVVRGYWK